MTATTASDALRVVYGANAAKKIARDFGVAVVTAKLWLRGQFPITRSEELCRIIEAELDRQDEVRAEIRRQIREQIWRKACEKNFAVGSGGSGKDLRRYQSPSSPVRRMGAMT